MIGHVEDRASETQYNAMTGIFKSIGKMGGPYKLNEDDIPEMGSGPADPQKVKEFWLDTVVPAERLGKLDKIPARKPRNLRECSQAQTQNYYLTRHSFGGFHSNYDNIKWRHSERGHK